MKWQVDMKVKDYIRNWSDQEIHTEYKGVTANIKIKDNNCKLELEGKLKNMDVNDMKKPVLVIM
ncbi:hypothetical protein G4970_16735, partial [[Ruminococcus] gnavus]|nr:hypothetical protein [Mediterraneibacter gnavus]